MLMNNLTLSKWSTDKSFVPRLKEQDEAFNRQKQEFQREINYLRLLLKEKEDHIQSLECDKKWVLQFNSVHVFIQVLIL